MTRRAYDSRPAVLVTGASKGIGEACAVRLARDGFRVYAGIRKEEDGLALIRHAGDGIVPIILDVTVPAQIAAAVAQIDEQTGDRGLQALVNNAGVAIAGPLEFLPIDELRRQLEINVIGQVAVTQACLPLIRRSKASTQGDHRAGRIVFMSSVAGRIALPFMGPYAASKHALEAIADSLRVELMQTGLRVSIIEPGVVNTPIWETSRKAGDANITRMPAEADALYGRSMAALSNRTRTLKGVPPEYVAEVVAHALMSRKPKIRYTVGRVARVRLLINRVAPDSVKDRLANAILRRL
jgi:NAD(P)-dependent dehydrogenase (short-subunit alcohol dehydrogenase family)